MKNFDSIIIGSGQAGTPLAFKLTKEGQKVAFIEKEHLGGTCLNTGCTPTKAYVASARRMWDALNGETMGIDIPAGAKANLKKIKARKDAQLSKSKEGLKKKVAETEDLHFYKGEAHFTGHKQVEVNGKTLKAENIFINVGARPVVPDEFKKVKYLDNASILELEELPEHLIIVGGSYIGLEFGQMFSRFGSKVTIIEQGQTIIGHEDADVSEAVLQFLQDEGIEFRLNARCVSGKNNADGSIAVQVDCNSGESEIIGSHLLLAVGHKPNTDSLNLEASGLKANEKGYIDVDDSLETAVAGIFVLGDCNGKGAFTHTSYNDYEIVIENRFAGRNRKVSDRITTYCLYTDPPLGRAGMSLAQAKKSGKNFQVAFMEMEKVARAREKGETKGFMRIIVDADSNKILGASILGVGGDEIIASLLNAMYGGITYDVIRDAVVPHPTVSELIPTMLGDIE